MSKERVELQRSESVWCFIEGDCENRWSLNINDNIAGRMLSIGGGSLVPIEVVKDMLRFADRQPIPDFTAGKVK
jgi:hypothetical protein